MCRWKRRADIPWVSSHRRLRQRLWRNFFITSKLNAVECRWVISLYEVCCIALWTDQLAQEEPKKKNRVCVCVFLLYLEGKQSFVWWGAEDWTQGQCTYGGWTRLIAWFYDEQTRPAGRRAVSRKWGRFWRCVLATPPKGWAQRRRPRWPRGFALALLEVTLATSRCFCKSNI